MPALWRPIALAVCLLSVCGVLASTPQGVGRTDAYGDPLPAGAYARLGTVRFRNAAHGVHRLAVSPDGKTLASCGSGYGSPISLWDARTGKELRRLRDVYGEHFCFTPDGKSLVSDDGDGKSVFWDVATGKPLRSLPGHQCVISTDGKTAITVVEARKDNESFVYDLCRWHVETGKKLRALQFPRRISALALAPDDRTVAVCFSSEIAFEDGEEKKVAIHLWDLTSGTEVGQLPNHHEYVACLAFAPDGKALASADPGNTIRVWDWAKGKVLWSRKSSDMIRSLAFSRDGKWLAWTTDSQRVRLRDMLGSQEPRAVGDTLRFNLGEPCLAFSPDGQCLFVAAGAGVIRRWDVATGKDTCDFEGHNRTVHTLAFTPDGRTLLTSSGATTIAWDLATRRERHRFADRVVAVAPDHRSVVCARNEDTLALVELATGQKTREWKLPWPLWDEFALALSPDGKGLAATLWPKDDGPSLWHQAAKAGETGKRFGRGLVRDFSADGKVLRVEVDHHLPRRFFFSLYDVATGLKLSPFGREKFPDEVALSSARSVLALAEAGRVRLWDFTARKELTSLPGCQKDVTDVFFSPDGRLLGTHDTHNRERMWSETEDRPSVRLWDVTTGKRLVHFGKPQAPAYQPTFSPDGRTLAAYGRDNTLRLWEVATGQERGRFLLEGLSLRAELGEVLAFSPDGRTLAAVTGTTVLLLDVTGRAPDGRWRPARLTTERLQTRWDGLAAADAARAYRAMWELAADPDAALALLRQRLRPVTPVSPRRLAQLVADLGNERYAVRRRATEELTRWGDLAEPALSEALDRQPSLEARRRIEQVLRREEGPVSSPETLRAIRALEVLEHIGTAPAREVLTELAGGAAGARLTREARAALDRLTRRRGPA